MKEDINSETCLIWGRYTYSDKAQAISQVSTHLGGENPPKGENLLG